MGLRPVVKLIGACRP